LFKKSSINLLLLLFFSVTAQNIVAQEDITKTDSLKTSLDSVVVDSTRIRESNQGAIKAPINYSAKDSMMISLKVNKNGIFIW